MTYTPDYWKIVSLTKARTGEEIKKVLAGWSSSYLSGAFWRLSSGIIDIKENSDHYLIPNQSGSLYVCFKSREGYSMIMRDIEKQFIDQCNFDGLEYRVIDMEDE